MDLGLRKNKRKRPPKLSRYSTWIPKRPLRPRFWKKQEKQAINSWLSRLYPFLFPLKQRISLLFDSDQRYFKQLKSRGRIAWSIKSLHFGTPSTSRCRPLRMRSLPVLPTPFLRNGKDVISTIWACVSHSNIRECIVCWLEATLLHIQIDPFD